MGRMRYNVAQEELWDSSGPRGLIASTSRQKDHSAALLLVHRTTFADMNTCTQIRKPCSGASRESHEKAQPCCSVHMDFDHHSAD